jgi:Thymidylate synthase
MWNVNARNVNGALAHGLRILLNRGIEQPSRNGSVISMPAPITTIYQRPTERVLMSPVRDANPFFHFMESMWMLNGDNDLAFPKMFNSRFGEYSDDGETLHGAYGYRWRKWFGYDQLNQIIADLLADRSSRRAVLAMWDGHHDPAKAASGGSDVPCNTTIYFRVLNEALHMTVCNRSNDVIWGAYGANVVHMSYLQEYVAACLGLNVGIYYQISNNYHVYTDIYNRDKLLEMVLDVERDKPYEARASGRAIVRPYPLFSGLKDFDLDVAKREFDGDLAEFISWARGGETYVDMKYSSEIFGMVAEPMFRAWAAHKQKDYPAAVRYAGGIAAMDWREACVDWLQRREAKYVEKQNATA